MSERHLTVHGHFYQPPRENPWTEEVAREPSAAPFHDWNERITAESYRPNGFARVVDSTGRVVSIVNSYEHLSFDAGPTLLSWLETHEPEVYERMVAGDRAGGGALAQSYFHVILPLADERDARTQIRWGLADFRHRFGRDAEGIWLPETAVNDAVLGMLADEGVRFTILAPSQAADPVDCRIAYRWEHPGGHGRGVDIVFFHGALSRAVAFEAQSSQVLVDRAIEASEVGGLVTLATDGETFGHHHHYADRALAYALTVEGPRRGLRITTPAAFLRDHPPAQTVTIHESAWSCAHGVGRWREDCGCSTGGEPGWNQRWRAPLRAALDLLRGAAVEVFERRGAKVLHEPWAARDDYVHVLLGARTRAEFAAEHVKGDEVEAFTLLESQRHAMAMYTSCGWFFNDLAGIETVYVLRHAARVIDLLHELGEEVPEGEFLATLQHATSNDPLEGNGRTVWKHHVLPARVDAERVVAHLALIELLERPLPTGRLAGFEVVWLDHAHRHRGAVALSTGKVALTQHRTGRRTEHVYAALHLGGLEVLGALRPADPSRDDADLGRVRAALAEGEPVSHLVRVLGEIGPTEFDLSWALPDAADQILASVADGLTERFVRAYDQLFEDNRATLDALAAAGYQLPPPLRAPGELALARRFEAEVQAQQGSWDPDAYRAAAGIAALAAAHGISLDTPGALGAMQRTILAAVDRALEHPQDPGAGDAALELLRLARELHLYPNVEAAQEKVYDALFTGGTPALRLLGTALGLAVETLGEPH